MKSQKSRITAASALVALIALAFAMHKRVVDSGDVVTAGRETVDIGEHVIAVLERDTRISFRVTKQMFTGEHASVEQRSGRAIYRVRDGSLDIRSADGRVDLAGSGVIVVDGARYAVAEGTPEAQAMNEDASLLRTLDDVNNAAGGDLPERLDELLRMRAELDRERLRAPNDAGQRSRH